MIAKNLENKLLAWDVENVTLHNTAITSADCYPLIQQIEPIDSAAGNTSQQRMGDRITPKSLTVKGIISFHQSYISNTNQSIYVRVVIAQQKDIRNSGNVTGTVDTNRLLHSALVGNDQVAFTGATTDLLYPINKNKFRVYMDKIIKLDPVVQSGALGWNGPAPSYSKRWSYTFKQLPAALTFDEGSGDWVNNFAPFVAMGYAFSDGSADPSTTLRLAHTVHSQLAFEDA